MATSIIIRQFFFLFTNTGASILPSNIVTLDMKVPQQFYLFILYGPLWYVLISFPCSLKYVPQKNLPICNLRNFTMKSFLLALRMFLALLLPAPHFLLLLYMLCTVAFLCFYQLYLPFLLKLTFWDIFLCFDCICCLKTYDQFLCWILGISLYAVYFPLTQFPMLIKLVTIFISN